MIESKKIFVRLIKHFPKLIILTNIIKEVSSLTMENVIVPPYVMQGDMAELICQFQLEQDNLYSVIWYKDHEEFYRFIPKSEPKQQSFKLDGAKIDHQRSGVHLVRMRVNSPAASGVYRCEVSAEAPSFTSAQGEARMEVVSLPIDDPIITGDIRFRHYQNGDTLALNCTAGKSYPPAQIVWFVNDKQVHNWFDYQGNLDRGSISELRFKLSTIHLTRESLLVRCVTIVGSQQYPIDTKETVLLIRGTAASVFVSNRYYGLMAIIIATQYWMLNLY